MAVSVADIRKRVRANKEFTTKQLDTLNLLIDLIAATVDGVQAIATNIDDDAGTIGTDYEANVAAVVTD